MITRSLGEKKQIFSAFTDVLAMYELMMLKQKNMRTQIIFKLIAAVTEPVCLLSLILFDKIVSQTVYLFVINCTTRKL